MLSVNDSSQDKFPRSELRRETDKTVNPRHILLAIGVALGMALLTVLILSNMLSNFREANVKTDQGHYSFASLLGPDTPKLLSYYQDLRKHYILLERVRAIYITFDLSYISLAYCITSVTLFVLTLIGVVRLLKNDWYLISRIVGIPVFGVTLLYTLVELFVSGAREYSEKPLRAVPIIIVGLTSAVLLVQIWQQKHAGIRNGAGTLARPRFTGKVQNFRERHEGIPIKHLFAKENETHSIVWDFRLERYGQDGERLAPIPVEMRGESFLFAINEGDTVGLYLDDWQEGELVETTRVFNDTSQVDVVARTFTRQGFGILMTIIFILGLVVALVSYLIEHSFFDSFQVPW